MDKNKRFQCNMRNRIIIMVQSIVLIGQDPESS